MINSEAVEAVAFFSAVAVVATAAAFAWARWLAHRYDVPKGGRSEVEGSEHLRLLQSELDALALEVERLGEGQRYTLRLLEERLPAALPPAAAAARGEMQRVITPH